METHLSGSIGANLGRHKNVVSKQFFQPTDPTTLEVKPGFQDGIADGGKPIIMCELAASLLSVRTQSFAAVERLLVDFGYRAFLVAKGEKLSPMSLFELRQQTHTFNVVLPPSTVGNEEALA